MARLRYKSYVASLRGFIRSEVGRILNRLVETHAPAEIVIERLNFQNQALSKRLNRILSRFGKNEVKRWPRLFRQFFRFHKWNPAEIAYADFASAGRFSK